MKKCEIRATISTPNTWLVVPDSWGFDSSAYRQCQWKGRGAQIINFLCKLASLILNVASKNQEKVWRLSLRA